MVIHCLPSKFKYFLCHLTVQCSNYVAAKFCENMLDIFSFARIRIEKFQNKF